jgi:hypothetical protein
VRHPSRFVPTSFRTQDVGRRGRLQRVAGKLKANGRRATQAWRLNLSDYRGFDDAVVDLMSLRIPSSKKKQALKLLRKWYKI